MVPTGASAHQRGTTALSRGAPAFHAIYGRAQSDCCPPSTPADPGRPALGRCGLNSLLLHLSRTIGESRILVVGTYRPDELIVSRQADRQLNRHPLATITGELKRQHGDIWLDLGAISEGEGRAFVDAYLDTQPNRLAEEFRAMLFQHTGGHALFTVELVREMRVARQLDPRCRGLLGGGQAHRLVCAAGQGRRGH